MHCSHEQWWISQRSAKKLNKRSWTVFIKWKIASFLLYFVPTLKTLFVSVMIYFDLFPFPCFICLFCLSVIYPLGKFPFDHLAGDPQPDWPYKEYHSALVFAAQSCCQYAYMRMKLFFLKVYFFWRE